MKSPSPLDEKTRFSGQMRHYHRSGPATQRSWDEWVDGTTKNSDRPKKWLKAILIIVSILILGAVIAGLAIELS